MGLGAHVQGGANVARGRGVLRVLVRRDGHETQLVGHRGGFHVRLIGRAVVP